MKNIFSSRAEYVEYVADCLKCGVQPWPFRQWFETTYHYEIEDEKSSDELLVSYSDLCLN